MSASRELQKGIYDALVADAAVGALIGDRIYDRMPSVGDYPCVTFGPSDYVTDDAECIDMQEHTVQLDVWSRDQGRQGPCKAIVDAVKAALHDKSLTLADPYACNGVYIGSARVVVDPDGTTAHGIVRVTAWVESSG